MISEYFNAKLEDLYFPQEHGGIDFTLKKYYLDAILFPFILSQQFVLKQDLLLLLFLHLNKLQNIGKVQS